VSDDWNLEGKSILVTGASRGIGRAVAQSLAARGASLILVARDAAALASAEMKLAGGPHRSAVLDVRDEPSWRRALEEWPEDPVDGLVTAAGVLGPIGRLGTWSVSAFRDTIDVNVLGTLVPILVLLPRLARGEGSVVTFSGGGATSPLPRYDAYAASKAAVVRLTENLARDLAETGVRLNAIAPGFVATTMHEATLAAGPDAAGREYFDRTRRLTADGADPPTHAAELAAFLLSSASRGITGKLISAQWDPWRDSSFQDRLRADRDLATIRRVDDQFFAAKER